MGRTKRMWEEWMEERHYLQLLNEFYQGVPNLKLPDHDNIREKIRDTKSDQEPDPDSKGDGGE